MAKRYTENVHISKKTYKNEIFNEGIISRCDFDSCTFIKCEFVETLFNLCFFTRCNFIDCKFYLPEFKDTIFYYSLFNKGELTLKKDYNNIVLFKECIILSEETNVFDFLHCVKVKSRVPEEGSFYAYTIMTDKNNKKASLAKVFIPEDALRATTTRGNCQVNYCIIEELESPLGDKISKGSIKAERINNINDLKIDNEDAITIYPTKGECRDALVKYYEHL